MESKNQGETIEVDGSLYEGGGQIIRNSMALSNILQKPFQIVKIRSGRSNPGLNNQLLGSIALLKSICDAKATSASINSQEMYYEPQSLVKNGEYKGGAKTAASISLMLQALIPTLLFSKDKSVLQLQGGTNVNKSPSFESIVFLLKPLLSRLGVNFEYKIIKDGYYPIGNGLAQLQINNLESTLKPIKLIDRDPPLKIYMGLYLTNRDLKPNELFKSMKKDVKLVIKSIYKDINVDEDIEFNVDVRYIVSKKFKQCYAVILQGYGKNTFIDASYFPGSSTETAEDCADKAGTNFVNEIKSGGCLDQHLQDQLLIYMGLAGGISQIRVGQEITPHSQAVFYILKKFIPSIKIKIEKDENDPLKSQIISIQGIGLKNPHSKEIEQEITKEEQN